MSELAELTNRVEHSVAELSDCLKHRGWFVGTAESCTGGWIAQMLTAAAGSSSWFESGIVTYSNTAKINLLGVRAERGRKIRFSGRPRAALRFSGRQHGALGKI